MGLALSACTIFFDDGGHKCEQPLDGTAAIPVRTQRNPETLVCQATSGGPSCDPDCGPCPAGVAGFPTWGDCPSSCEQLSEQTCAQQPGCRVVRDARCAVLGDCARDYIGCFPTDEITDITLACATATDGQTCSRSERCTALHRQTACPFDAQCPIEFAMCIPEGSQPGKCHEPAACDALPPACPSGTTPGVVDGCWSGACIPNDLCEP